MVCIVGVKMRGQDVCRSSCAPGGDAVPRHGYAIALALVVLFILYGSLYPFDYRERFYPGGSAAFLLSTWREWDDRRDLLSNILLYIPFGCFAALALPGGCPGIIRVLAGILGGALLSVCMETSQFNVPERYPSMGDVYADSIGAALGAVAAALVGAGARWPLVGEFLAQQRSAMLLVMWAAYRLYPYRPAIDVHKLVLTMQTIVFIPSLPPDAFARFTIVWMFIGSILDSLYGFPRWLLLFPLLAASEFLGRLLVVSVDLKLADIAGAAAAFAIWLLLRWLPWRFSILSVAFAALVTTLRLMPFTFEPVGRPFGWVPFYSMMYGSGDVAIQSFCEKFYLYGGLIWLLCRAGMNLGVAIELTTLLLFATSYAETWLPGRSAEITDVVMALMIGGVFALFPAGAAAKV